ncbi:MAG: hypothetical protein K0R00_59 [Herbinix sp.]|jgi:hypothetical protein|nr:hypothetical protein [Herbinix sp.]
MLSRSCEEAERYERDGYECCGYCGSLYPKQLAELIKEGKAIMSGSDWKYGWPHKFYVSIPNPKAGEIVELGHGGFDEDCEWNANKPIMGGASKFLTMKFYSRHLELLSKEEFDEIAPIISEACGVKFEIKENGFCYSAPYDGFQKTRF